jgi:hypothetical protein
VNLQESDLHATLAERFGDVIASLSAIDARKAKASHDEHKTLIDGRIHAREGGFDKFNADVARALRQWLLATAKALLEVLGTGDSPALRDGSEGATVRA